MTAKISVTLEGSERILELPPRGTFVIGRGEACDLPLADRKLSRQHCAIEVSAGGCQVRDLGSRNGTKHNDRPLGQEPVALAAGDLLILGLTRIRFIDAGTPADPEEPEIETIPVEEHGGLSSDPLGEAEFLLIIEEPPAGESEPSPRREFGLLQERITFGTSRSCDLVLVDRKVSGIHGELVDEDGLYVVRDLGSTNGTRVAGRKVSGEGETLSHGDQILAGATRLTFKHRDLPLDDEFLRGVAGVSSVPRGRGRTPTGAILVTIVALLAVGGLTWVWLQARSGQHGDTDQVVAPPTDSLIQEGFSFEETPTGSVPEDYVLVRGDGSVRVTDLKAASGTHALQLVPEGELVIGPREPVPVSPGGECLHARVQALVSGACAVGLQLRCYARLGEDAGDGSGGEDFIHTFAIPTLREGTGSFQPLAATFEIPYGADHAALEIVARGSGTVLIDDVVLERTRSQLAAELDVATLRGQFLTYCQDRQGVFLIERLQDPLVQNGAVSLHDEGSRYRPTDVDATSVTLAVEERTVRWSGRHGDADHPSRPPRLSTEARVTSSGLDLTVAVADDAGDDPVEILVVFETTLHWVAGPMGIIGDEARVKLQGDFDLQDIFQIIFGIDDPGRRCTLALDPPCQVNLTRVDGRPTFRIRTGAARRLQLRWESSFQADRGRLRDLLEAARDAERQRRYGAAMERYRRVIQEFPFQEAEKAQAEASLERLRQQGEARVTEIMLQVQSTERLGHLNFYEATRRDIEQFEQEYEDTRFASEVAPLREAIVERLDAEAAAARENQASRIYHSGMDFLSEGFTHVGLAKLRYGAEAFTGNPDDPGYAWGLKCKEALETPEAGPSSTPVGEEEGD
jgi:pSer/pThr/pTyr-binding forkhead associated (FHA) protein